MPFKQIKTKILFFNRDQYAKTRKLICEISEKILIREPKEQEIWKVVWEYFEDKDNEVAKVAAKTLFENKVDSHFQNLSNELENSDKTNIFLSLLDTYLKTFKEFYLDPTAKGQRNKLISFLNRIIKSENQQQIAQIFSCFSQLLQAIPEGTVYSELAFDYLNPTKKNVLKILIDIYFQITDIEFKERIRNQIFKGIKHHSFAFYQKTSKLIKILDLQQEQDENFFLNLINKMFQNNKWYCLLQLLPSICKMRMLQPIYEKLSFFLLRLILTTPYFLIKPITRGILHILLVNKRSLQFLITIRQKLMNSKCWAHRRNYMFLYFLLKTECSFDFHKLVPMLNYKNIPVDKAPGIKLEFLRCAPLAYKSLDPGTDQKNMMRETVNRMTQDRDLLIARTAIEVQMSLLEISQNLHHIHEAYERSLQLCDRELTIRQVQIESKKLIKTEKELRRSVKKKTETRTTLNLTKEYRRDISPPKTSKTVNIEPKKMNIYRHNSNKVKPVLPNGKLKF